MIETDVVIGSVSDGKVTLQEEESEEVEDSDIREEGFRCQVTIDANLHPAPPFQYPHAINSQHSSRVQGALHKLFDH